MFAIDSSEKYIPNNQENSSVRKDRSDHLLELFRKKVAPNDLEAYYFSATLNKVILPILSKLNIYVLRPEPNEASRIISKLNMITENESDLKITIKNNGIYNMPYEYEDFKIIQLAMVIKDAEQASKPKGAIHYFFRRGICDVQSIKILRVFQGRKYGSFLLSAAILDAKANGISKITLKSNRESFGFYLNFGFIPEYYLNKRREWSGFSAEEKILAMGELGKLVSMQLNLEESKDYEGCISQLV